MAVLTCAVASIGFRVPRDRLSGIVRAVFARAGYVECGDTLLTIAASGVANGPTTLVLRGDAPADLRDAIAPGDALRGLHDRIEGRNVVLELARAQTWRPRVPRSLLGHGDRARRAAMARDRLVQSRRTRSSVLDRSGAAAIAGVEEACRKLDIAAARARIARFVGWGEGLTPAGDDYLVGLCAALGVLTRRDGRRNVFLEDLRRSLASSWARTTPVSAHYLALAADGHFNADVLRARDALRAGRDAYRARIALDALIALGSTSGADALTGILSGFAAWDPSPVDQPLGEHEP
jgi:hypothetical protein